MGLHGVVKSTYVALTDAASNNRLTDYKSFAEQEADTWKHWVSMPPRRRLSLWRRGFTSPAETMYDFQTHGQEAYLSERQRIRLYREANGGHRYLLDDKLSQYWMMADYPEHRPEAFGFVDRGYVHGIAGTTFEGDPRPVAEWLPGAVREHSKLVLKQLRGLGGSEVVVCEYDDGFVVDAESVTEREMCETVADLSGYVVTEYVDQHAYADDLYPHAANTIRMLTLWDDETGELHVPIAIHRIGTERSRPIDNWSAGGLSVEIDLETGELGRATRKPHGDSLRWYEDHPDTGAPIAGTRVPHWDAVRETVERIAKENTNIPLLGWDVLLDESGTPVVLEVNTGTDVDLLQVHQPLLADPAFARVAARYLPDVEAPPAPDRPKRRPSPPSRA